MFLKCMNRMMNLSREQRKKERIAINKEEKK